LKQNSYGILPGQFFCSKAKAGLGQFSDKVVQRFSDVQELIRRINFYVDPEPENAGF